MSKSKIYDSEDEKHQKQQAQQKANANDGGNKPSEQKGGKNAAGKETLKR